MFVCFLTLSNVAALGCFGAWCSWSSGKVSANIMASYHWFSGLSCHEFMTFGCFIHCGYVVVVDNHSLVWRMCLMAVVLLQCLVNNARVLCKGYALAIIFIKTGTLWHICFLAIMGCNWLCYVIRFFKNAILVITLS